MAGAMWCFRNNFSLLLCSGHFYEVHDVYMLLCGNVTVKQNKVHFVTFAT